jgi:non-homologous end joining protein Ku
VPTALRYPDEVRDLSHIPELESLPEPDEEGLALMTKIVDKKTVDLDLSLFHDSYWEKMEALISSKAEGRGCAGGREEAQEAGSQEHDGGTAEDGGVLEVIFDWAY